MTEQDKKYVIEALEYALHKCIDVDGNSETHYNTLANAIEVVKNCSIQSVSVSSFREIPIAPMTDLEKQFNISTHDAAIRTLKEMNIPQNLIEKKSNSR